MESAPYVAGFSAPQDEEQRKNLLTTIGDWLGTTGRITTNLLEDAILQEWNDPIRRAMPWSKDIRRSSMENILFGGEASTGDQLQGAIPVADEKGGGRQVLRKGAGFLADVLIDPLSYVSFGATAPAKAAATAFAKRAAQQAVRQLDNPKVAQRVFGETIQKKLGAQKSFGLKPDEEALLNARYQNQVYRDAYREALSTPSATLKKNFTDRLNDEKIKLNDLIENPPGDKKFWEGIRKRAQQQVDEIDKDLDWVNTRWDTEFGAMGEGSLRFMGKELFRQPQPGFIRQNIAQAGATVREFARTNPLTKKALDAWWSVSNTGVLGSIRQTLGFYNPVGKVLNAVRVANQKRVLTTTRDNVDEVENMFKGVTDEQKQDLSKLFLGIDEYTATRMDAAIKAKQLDINDKDAVITFARQSNREALQDPGVRALIQPENQETVFNLYAQSKQLTDRWFQEEQAYAAQGIIEDFNELDNYLPIAWRRRATPYDEGAQVMGAPTYGPHMIREAGHQANRKAEAEKLSVFFGFTKEQAEEVVEHNLSSLITDVQAALRARGTTNARVHGRAHLLETVRPWGINVNETQHTARLSDSMPKVNDVRELERDMMIRKLKESYDRNSGDLGLHRIQDGGPFFDNMLFPTEVANIITRTVKIIGRDATMFSGRLGQYTRWWSNVVTLSPRYHLRNMVSNFSLMFLRHGVEAFNPRFWVASVAGASQRLKTPASKLTERAAKITGSLEERMALGWNVGDHTVEELSREAYERGVISKVSYAAGGLAGDLPEQAVRKAAKKWNVPKRAQDAAFRTSQNIGSIVESSQRFNMFLLNAKKMMRPGKTRLTDSELDFAAMEANKWMVDYANLTDFERNVLRFVFPFYSWIRHNLPNMIEMVKDNPALFNTALKGEKALFDMVSGGIEVDQDLVPDWMLEMNYMPLSQDEEGNVVFGYSGLPWAELNVIPVSFPGQGRFGMPRFEARQFLTEIANRANPVFKTVAEVASNTRMLTGQSLEGLVVVPSGMHGWKADWALPFLRTMDGFATLFDKEGMGFTDATGRANLDNKGRLKMEGWAYSVLTNNMPVIQWMGSLFQGGATAMDRLGLVSYDTLSQMDLTDPTKDSFDTFIKNLGFFGGIATTEKNLYKLRAQQQRDAARQRNLRRNYSTRPIIIND